MKVFTGKIISKKGENTAKVSVERVIVHPVYKKRFKRVKNYQVHDDLGTKVNNVVKFVGSRPYSKYKKWKIIEIVSEGAKVKKEGKKQNARIENKMKERKTKS